MLKAKNKKGEDILAWKIPRPINLKETYSCDDCKEDVTFVDATLIVPHFRHKPKSSCASNRGNTEPESQEHLNMKKDLCVLLGEQQKLPFKIEHWIIPEKSKADIVLFSNNNELIIECQASAISKRKMLNRTLRYSECNLYVLWIFEKEMYLDLPFTFKKFIQSMYFGRAYVYDLEKKHILPLRFFPEGGHSFGNPINNFRLIPVESQTFKYGMVNILRFIDKKWWGGE